MNVTSVFHKNLEAYNLQTRIIANKGSTRSSKTYSILQLLYLIAEISSKPKVISIVSESMPHLKKGCIRNFKEILTGENKWDENNWNATDRIYKVNRSIIEFFSVDQPAKVHGPERDILYVNECINIEWETYRQLSIRTRETIFLDCNPSYEFWLDERVLVRPDSVLIHSTYKDNEYLTREQVNEIESNRHDEAWFRVYGLGLTGNKEGLVMQNWNVVSAMPETYKRRWIGLDFGFTNDPTAIVDMRLCEGELWIDELLFDKGYDNMMIAAHLDELDIPHSVAVVADCAEPKSIKEIRSQGWMVEPARKGKDSINTGISLLNRYVKHITQRSTNILNEYRNYRWLTDEFGKATNQPVDRYNHSIDAQRYVALNKLIQSNSSLSYAVIGGRKNSFSL